MGVNAVSQLPDVGTRASGEERVVSILRRVGKNDLGGGCFPIRNRVSVNGWSSGTVCSTARFCLFV